MKTAYYSCPLGLLKIGEENGAICQIKCVDKPDAPHHPTPLSDRAARDLTEYFAGKRTVFTLPIHTAGTPFQQMVWQALLAVPHGETRSYGEIAQAIGKPAAARAVGMACNRNPVWIIIPCHRIVGRNGALTGYEGGLDRKAFLLQLEQHT